MGDAPSPSRPSLPPGPVSAALLTFSFAALLSASSSRGWSIRDQGSQASPFIPPDKRFFGGGEGSTAASSSASSSQTLILPGVLALAAAAAVGIAAAFAWGVELTRGRERVIVHLPAPSSPSSSQTGAGTAPPVRLSAPVHPSVKSISVLRLPTRAGLVGSLLGALAGGLWLGLSVSPVLGWSVLDARWPPLMCLGGSVASLAGAIVWARGLRLAHTETSLVAALGERVGPDGRAVPGGFDVRGRPRRPEDFDHLGRPVVAGSTSVSDPTGKAAEAAVRELAAEGGNVVV
jgi:hypothetical protein